VRDERGAYHTLGAPHGENGDEGEGHDADGHTDNGHTDNGHTGNGHDEETMLERGPAGG
jgi:hypothetical protein